MKVKAIILWSLFLQCLLYTTANANCPIYADPNDYIDDPNTIENGLFESCDPNLTIYDFNSVTYWERIPHPDSLILTDPEEPDDCYAGIHYFFAPDIENPPGWRIKSPFEGENFIVLSTGGFKTKSSQPCDIIVIDDSKIQGASIAQRVVLEPNDTIIGAFFFGTTDYGIYNDYGQIKLKLDADDPNDYPNSVESFVVPGTYCDVSIVGDGQSTEERQPIGSASTGGWISFVHAVEPNQVGPYWLICEVVDAKDNIVNSYYAVDGLRICRASQGGKPIADLDFDCDVDLVDYSILSMPGLWTAMKWDAKTPLFMIRIFHVKFLT